MKKILDIVPYNYLPYFSGGQKSIAQFLEHLGAVTDLTVVTVAENDFSLAKNYGTIPLLKTRSSSRYSDYSLISKISEIIRKEKFELVIWEHPYYAWLAYRVKKNTGIKTVIRSHNIEHQRFKTTGKWWWPMLGQYEKWSFRFADYIFFVTDEDRQFAIKKWTIAPEKCWVIPFGINIKEYPPDKEKCKEIVKKQHLINQNEKIFFFNGLLDYKPNLDALLVILNQVNPILLKKKNFNYKIIICGKRLPAYLNELKEHEDKNIIYAGFVDDIETYFKAADLFLNPVQSGGGVKTKMIEAIGFGTTVIATETAAIGADPHVCGDKLIIVQDNNWENFAKQIVLNADKNIITPPSFYEKYYWGNVVKKIASL